MSVDRLLLTDSVSRDEPELQDPRNFKLLSVTYTEVLGLAPRKVVHSVARSTLTTNFLFSNFFPRFGNTGTDQEARCDLFRNFFIKLHDC